MSNNSLSPKEKLIIFAVFMTFVIVTILVNIPNLKSRNTSRITHSHTGTSYASSARSSTAASKTPTRPPVNLTPAMTKEEAERLKGTGYNGCRPNSAAERTALGAAQHKCRNCGYHTDNGRNSLCDYCAWIAIYGGGLPKSKESQSSNTTSSGNKNSSSSSEKTDPYDAKSYAHPDDFYYDYYDDFVDYEEAEDYWEEHQ